MFQFNHRKTRFAIVAGIAAIGLGQISVNLAAQSSSEDVRLTYPAAGAPVQATVNAYGNSIDFDFNLHADFAVVRISGPDFYTVSKRIENADHVSVDLLKDLDFSAYVDNEIEEKALADAVSLPDGRYTFEIMVHSAEGVRHTTRGRFEVFSGDAFLLPPRSAVPSSDKEVSAVGEPGLMERLAGSILGFIVPSAHAQSSFVDDFFTIRDDAQDNDTGVNFLQDGSFTEFGMRNVEGVFKLKDSFGAISPSDTVFLNIIGSTGKVGFGTEEPQTTMHLVTPNTFAGFRLEDSRNTWQISTGGIGGDLGFRIGDISAETTPFRIESSAPSDSIRVAANGNVGVGTSTPSTALNVVRSDNTAVIQVDDTGALDGQALFNLRNNGHPSFRLQDTSQADVRWQFATSGEEPNDCFIVNKIGSGSLEMQVCAGGDMEIAGTLSQGSSKSVKQDITNVDPQSVLAKLASLPVAEWSYTAAPESRHFGPMAEDFHAIYELGQSEKHIAPGDLAGVAIAAAKALHSENRELLKRIQRLENMASAEVSGNSNSSL